MADPLTEFLKLFEVKPEEAGQAAAEFAGGGSGAAAFDGILESIYLSNPEYWTNKFPYVPFPIFPENMPPIDDWIVAGVPAILTALGALMKDKSLFRVGVGGSVYSVGMLIHHVLVRSLPKATPPTLTQQQQYGPAPPQPSQSSTLKTILETW